MTGSPEPFGLPGRFTGDGRITLIDLTAPVVAARPERTADDPTATRDVGTQSATTRSDDEQIRHLYRHHARAVQAFASRLLQHDHAAAEDVVQETLLRAWRHPDLASYRPPAQRAWLLTVARNIVTDRLRHSYRAPHRQVTAVEAPSEPTSQVDPDHADRVATAVTVAEAMAALTPEHRAVIEHLYYRGRTTEETAAVLGIPAGTVKSRRHYAVEMLQHTLGQGGAW